MISANFVATKSSCVWARLAVFFGTHSGSFGTKLLVKRQTRRIRIPTTALLPLRGKNQPANHSTENARHLPYMQPFSSLGTRTPHKKTFSSPSHCDPYLMRLGLD